MSRPSPGSRSLRSSCSPWVLWAWWIVLLLLGSPIAAASGDLPASDPVEIPEAPLDGLEPAVREQLQEKRERLETLLHSTETLSEGPDDTYLVPAYGDLGQLYLLYDRPETAAACFENVVRLRPGEPNAWYYLGVIHQDAGRFEPAAEAFARVLEARPDDLPSLLRSGEIRFQQRRLDEAEAFFEKAAALDPDSASAAFGLGRVANARRQWPDAVRHFERTLALQGDADSVYHPLGLAYRRLGDLESAKAALTQAGPNAPIFDDPLMRALFELTATSRSFFIEGNRARRRGLPELAEAHYRRALELDPTDASVHYNLGTLLGERGRVTEAETHFRRAVEHKSDHRDARFNLAVSLRARGELAAAAEHFRKVVELDPDDTAAAVELGVTLFAAGRNDPSLREEGAALLERLAEGPIQDAATGLQLARYLEQIGGSAAWIDKVLAASDAVADRPEDRVEIRLLQSERARARGEVDAAAERLADAVRVAPLDPRPAVRLSMIHCAAGRHGEAIRELEEASERLGDDPAVASTLARLLATVPDPALRRGEQALAIARRLHEQDPSPPNTAALAMALAATGDLTGAGALQERLLRELGTRVPPTVRRRLETNLDRYRRGELALPPC